MARTNQLAIRRANGQRPRDPDDHRVRLLVGTITRFQRNGHGGGQGSIRFTDREDGTPRVRTVDLQHGQLVDGDDMPLDPYVYPQTRQKVRFYLTSRGRYYAGYIQGLVGTPLGTWSEPAPLDLRLDPMPENMRPVDPRVPVQRAQQQPMDIALDPIPEGQQPVGGAPAAPAPVIPQPPVGGAPAAPVPVVFQQPVGGAHDAPAPDEPQQPAAGAAAAPAEVPDMDLELDFEIEEAEQVGVNANA